MSIYAISSISAAVILISLGWFVFRKNPRHKINRLFLVSNTVIALWLIGCFGESVFSADFPFLLAWDKFLNLFAVFSPALFVHIVFAIINSKEHKYLKVNYLISTFLAISIVSPLYSPGIRSYYGVRFITVPGPIYYVFVLFLGWCGYLSITRTLNALFHVENGEKKNQFKYLLFAVMTIVIAAFVYFLMTFNVKVLPIDNWLNVAYGVIMAYAITKTRLMDISVVISRTAAWLMTVGFLGLVYAALLWLFRSYVSSQINVLFFAWNLVFAVIVGEMFQRIRLFFQTTSDKLFLHGKYDYYKSLSEVSSEITKHLSMENIKRILQGTFSNILEVANPRFYLDDDFERLEVKPFLDIEELTFLENDLVIPCRLEGRLIAVIVLGKKLSEDPYTEEDLRLLRALANQAAIAIDHTRTYEEIKKELEKTEKKLERSQRLAALGTLTAGVTHEIRNPMAIMRLQAETLFDKTRDETYLKKFQATLLENIDRVQAIVDGMLRLAKNKGPESFNRLNLNEVLEKTLSFLDFGRITVQKDLKPVPPIMGEAGDFNRIFINLLQNSIQALAATGSAKREIRLSTGTEGKWAVVKIADNGPGIPPDLREKIFDPFFSTRHEGVGLGLSIVFRLVEDHKGTLELKSDPGEGTEFTLRFPVVDSQ